MSALFLGRLCSAQTGLRLLYPGRLIWYLKLYPTPPSVHYSNDNGETSLKLDFSQFILSFSLSLSFSFVVASSIGSCDRKTSLCCRYIYINNNNVPRKLWESGILCACVLFLLAWIWLATEMNRVRLKMEVFSFSFFLFSWLGYICWAFRADAQQVRFR